MKTHLHLLLLLVCSHIAAFAQNSHPDKLPWVDGKLPPVKGRYEYKVTQGEGRNLKDARNDAFSAILVDLGNKAGITVNSRSVVELKSSLNYNGKEQTYNESDVQTNTFAIEREGFRAAFTKVGEYYEGGYGNYRIWELYEVSQGEKFAAYIPEYTTRYGASAALRSVVPGWGQFYKGKTAKGVLFLTSEVLLATGAVYCEMMRSDNFRKSQETTNLTIIKEYRNRADNWKLYRNAAIGAAAGVYVWNLLDAALAKGKVRYAAIPRNLHLYADGGDGAVRYGVAVRF